MYTFVFLSSLRRQHRGGLTLGKIAFEMVIKITVCDYNVVVLRDTTYYE